jgi:hypothetical protein
LREQRIAERRCVHGTLLVRRYGETAFALNRAAKATLRGSDFARFASYVETASASVGVRVS